jgi:hypothetical protein
MVGWTVMWWALVGGGFLSAATVVGVLLFWRLATDHPNMLSKPGRDPIPSSATWKFSDSWASNLTGLIAALAAIITAFGDDVPAVGKTQAAQFAVAAAVLVALTATAPLIYATLAPGHLGGPDEPDLSQVKYSKLALFASAFVTLVGSFGTLFALAWVIFYRSDLSEDGRTGSVTLGYVHRGTAWLEIAPGIAAAVVCAYAVRTLIQLLRWFYCPGRTVADAAMAGLVSRTCCSGEKTFVRMNLL